MSKHKKAEPEPQVDRDQFLADYARNAFASKLALWIVILAQLPLIYLIWNRTFPEFEVDGCYYHHMHMIAFTPDRILGHLFAHSFLQPRNILRRPREHYQLSMST